MTTPAYAPRWVRADEAPSWRADEILPRLFMGGTADDDVVFVPSQRHRLDDEKRFDAVVTLYAWAQPATWEVEELRYGFPDADVEFADVDRLVRAARWAYDRWQAGDRVLVRCQAGLNRSGLVTALVLLLDGYSPADAVTLLRLRRSPWVLCNDDFVRWLHEHAEKALSRHVRHGEPA